MSASQPLRAPALAAREPPSLLGTRLWQYTKLILLLLRSMGFSKITEMVHQWTRDAKKDIDANEELAYWTRGQEERSDTTNSCSRAIGGPGSTGGATEMSSKDMNLDRYVQAKTVPR